MTLGTHAVDVHNGVIAHPPVALHAWPCSCSTQQCQWLLQQTKWLMLQDYQPMRWWLAFHCLLAVALWGGRVKQIQEFIRILCVCDVHIWIRVYALYCTLQIHVHCCTFTQCNTRCPIYYWYIPRVAPLDAYVCSKLWFRVHSLQCIKLWGTTLLQYFKSTSYHWSTPCDHVAKSKRLTRGDLIVSHGSYVLYVRSSKVCHKCHYVTCPHRMIAHWMSAPTLVGNC